MAHLTTDIPFKPAYRYKRTPMYRTTVASAASARTERNSRWSYSLHMFELPLTNRMQPELEDITRYFHAARGAGNTFEMEDRFEDRSCALADTPAQDDITLGTAVASQTDFQLIKTYTEGGQTQSRKITRPIASTVLIEKDTVLQTITTDYTIETGGIIRFTSGMTGGEVIKSGFRFLVPVAFLRDDLPTVIGNKSDKKFIASITVELEEVRE